MTPPFQTAVTFLFFPVPKGFIGRRQPADHVWEFVHLAIDAGWVRQVCTTSAEVRDQWETQGG
jgi:hypothetical protein